MKFRLRPIHYALLLAGCVAAAGAGWHVLRSGGEPSAVRPGKPPVGAFAIRDKGEGKTDFAMQTGEGRFGMRSGSRDLSDLPYGFTLYPRAEIIDSISLKGANAAQTGKILRFGSTDGPDKVIAFYRAQARDGLLRIVTDQRIGGLYVLTGTYPDGRDGGFQMTVRRTGDGGSDATLSAGFAQDVAASAGTEPELPDPPTVPPARP